MTKFTGITEAPQAYIADSMLSSYTADIRQADEVLAEEDMTAESGTQQQKHLNIHSYFLNNYSFLLKMSGKNTAKVVRFLLRSTEKRGHNINQVAKSLRISVGSSFQVLKELEKKGMAVSEQIGNAAYYSLDFENPETVKLCELLLLEEKRQLKGYAKVYAADLQRFSHATLIILFGSILTRKEFNDVDVLFVTDKVKKVNDFCLDLSKVRAKPIVPIILKKEDLFHELRDRNGAVVSIIKEGVVLKGESTLIEVAKHGK